MRRKKKVVSFPACWGQLELTKSWNQLQATLNVMLPVIGVVTWPCRRLVAGITGCDDLLGQDPHPRYALAMKQKQPLLPTACVSCCLCMRWRLSRHVYLCSPCRNSLQPRRLLGVARALGKGYPGGDRRIFSSSLQPFLVFSWRTSRRPRCGQLSVEVGPSSLVWRRLVFRLCFAHRARLR